MTLLTQISLAITIILTVILVELLTSISTVTVNIFRHLITSLTDVAVALHAISANHTLVAIHAAVTDPRVPCLAIITMILLKRDPEGVV